MSIKILQQVLEHAPVDKGALLVLIALADSADEVTRECWPSVRLLAERARLSERQAQMCIRELVERVILVVHPNAGRNGTNLYRITPVSAWEEAPDSPSENDANGGVQKLRGGEAHFTGGVKPTSPGGVKPTSPEPSYRTVNEPSNTREVDLFKAEETPKQRKEDRGFDEFWKLYPKKAGKPAALKAWRAAMKRGVEPDEILAGARDYAGSEAVARGFVKFPQGWLNDERWRDEPTSGPSTTQTFDKPTGGHRLRPAYGEVVR